MDIDKYSLISLAPSLAIVATVIGCSLFAVIQLKKLIDEDAAKARVRSRDK